MSETKNEGIKQEFDKYFKEQNLISIDQLLQEHSSPNISEQNQNKQHSSIPSTTAKDHKYSKQDYYQNHDNYQHQQSFKQSKWQPKNSSHHNQNKQFQSNDQRKLHQTQEKIVYAPKVNEKNAAILQKQKIMEEKKKIGTPSINFLQKLYNLIKFEQDKLDEIQKIQDKVDQTYGGDLGLAIDQAKNGNLTLISIDQIEQLERKSQIEKSYQDYLTIFNIYKQFHKKQEDDQAPEDSIKIIQQQKEQISKMEIENKQQIQNINQKNEKNLETLCQLIIVSQNHQLLNIFLTTLQNQATQKKDELNKQINFNDLLVLQQFLKNISTFGSYKMDANSKNENQIQKSYMTFSQKVNELKSELHELFKEQKDSDNFIQNSFFRLNSNLINIKYSDIQQSLKNIENDRKFSKESPVFSNPLIETNDQIMKLNNFGLLQNPYPLNNHQLQIYSQLPQLNSLAQLQLGQNQPLLQNQKASEVNNVSNQLQPSKLQINAPPFMGSQTNQVVGVQVSQQVNLQVPPYITHHHHQSNLIGSYNNFYQNGQQNQQESIDYNSSHNQPSFGHYQNPYQKSGFLNLNDANYSQEYKHDYNYNPSSLNYQGYNNIQQAPQYKYQSQHFENYQEKYTTNHFQQQNWPQKDFNQNNVEVNQQISSKVDLKIQETVEQKSIEQIDHQIQIDKQKTEQVIAPKIKEWTDDKYDYDEEEDEEENQHQTQNIDENPCEDDIFIQSKSIQKKSNDDGSILEFLNNEVGKNKIESNADDQIQENPQPKRLFYGPGGGQNKKFKTNNDYHQNQYAYRGRGQAYQGNYQQREHENGEPYKSYGYRGRGQHYYKRGYSNRDDYQGRQISDGQDKQTNQQYKVKQQNLDERTHYNQQREYQRGYQKNNDSTFYRNTNSNYQKNTEK